MTIETAASSPDDNNPVNNEDPMAFSKEIQLDFVFNAMMSRSDMINKFMDPRRDYDKECGYPRTEDIEAKMYRKLYDRDPVAARVVDLMPEECWKTLPEIYEDENPDVNTPFEQSLQDAEMGLKGGSFYASKEGQGSAILDYLKRLDRMSRIGSFGVMLLGLDDLSINESFRKPAPGFEDDTVIQDGSEQNLLDDEYDTDFTPDTPSPQEENQRRDVKLLYLRVFDESQVEISQYEVNPGSPRYGQPKMYRLTMVSPQDQSKGGTGMPTNTIDVHWSRVIHSGGNLNSNEVFAEPAMRPVFNRLMDLTKLYGGSAEMYWKGAFPGLSLEIDPQAAASVEVDQASIKEAMWKYTNSLQRWFQLTGVSAKTLPTQVVDPMNQIQVQLEAICVKLRVPKRIFMGSERGELSSSQDKSSWNEVITEHQQNHVIPRVIVPFIDRGIKIGFLKPPAKNYVVEWNGIDLSTPSEKASYGNLVMQGLSTYIAGNVDSLIEPLDALTRLYGIKELDAKMILENRSRTLESQREIEDENQEIGLEQQRMMAQGAADAQDGEGDPAAEDPADTELPPEEAPAANYRQVLERYSFSGRQRLLSNR